MLLPVLLFVATNAWCQQRSRIDSMEVAVLANLAPAPDSAEAALGRLRIAVKQAGDPDSTVRTGYLQAALLERRGELAGAWRLIREVDALPTVDPGVRAQVKNMLGRIAYSNDEFDAALAAYHVLLSFPVTDSTRYAVTLNNLARVHARTKDHAKAADALERSVGIYKRSGDRSRLAQSLINLSVAQYDLKRYPASEANARHGLELAVELDMPEVESIAWETLGNGQRETGRHVEALKSYAHALALCERTNSLEGKASVNRNIGELHLAAGAPARAIQHLERTLTIADSMGSRNYAMDAHLLLSRAMEDLGRSSEALAHLRAYNTVQDSVHTAEKRDALAGWNARLGLLEKERVILEQEVRAAHDRAAVEEGRRTVRYMVAGGIVLMLLIALLVRDRMRARRLNAARMKSMEQQRTIAVMGALIEGEERERRRVAAELHDGIGVMLGTARLQLEGPDDRSRAKAGKLIADAGSEVRRVSHALMPGSLLQLGLLEALRELADGINSAGGMQVQVHGHGLKERLPQALEVGLYRIAQEAINNALKHAAATRCTVELSLEDAGRRCQLVVADDGSGFATGASAAGNGIMNIRTRTLMLGGTSDLASAPGNGTTWTIDVPVPTPAHA